MTTTKHIHADAQRARAIRIGATSITALAEAGARGQTLSPLEIRAVCAALHAQGRRMPTQFHSGV